MGLGPVPIDPIWLLSEDLTVADLQMVESNEAFSNGARGPDPLSAVR